MAPVRLYRVLIAALLLCWITSSSLGVVRASGLQSFPSRRRALEPIATLNRTCKSTYNCQGNLVCLTKQDAFSNTSFQTCTFCSKSNECSKDYGILYECETSSSLAGHFCLHKPLWPLTWHDILGGFLFLFGTALGAGSGLGAGGILVPLLVILYQFSAQQAIALSNVHIFGSSIANFILSFRNRHPNADRPIIYFDFALMCQPMLLLGSIIGATLNQLFPDYVILALLIVVLALTKWRSTMKGLELTKIEKNEAKKQKEAIVKKPASIEAGNSDATEAESTPETVERGESSSVQNNESDNVGSLHDTLDINGHDSLEESGGGRSSTELTSVSVSAEGQAMAKESPQEAKGPIQDSAAKSHPSVKLSQMLKSESRMPWHKIGVLFAILALLLAHALVLGGRARSIAGIHKCSTTYWLVYFSIFPIMAAIAYGIWKYLQNVNKTRKEINYVYLPGDVKWNSKASAIVTFASLFAGLFASLVGVGTGLVTNPLLMEFKVIATVVSATSSFMLIFGSLSSVIQFSIGGILPLDYSIYIGILGFLSGLMGQLAIEWIIRKYNQKSFVIWSILGTVCIAAILLIVTSSLNLSAKIKNGADLGFREYCPTS